jgi:uncharacterized SAM-binding protein YcdF (DUF218 family)
VIQAALHALYDFLSPSGPPEPADAVFVFAGQMERKEYGVALWREGLAPAIVLSVGRFEWRRVPLLGLPPESGLVELVERTPPPERHFFLEVDRERAAATLRPVLRFGTAGEAASLVEEAVARGWRTVLVVSTPFHLRRARLALRRLGRGAGCRFLVTAVPQERTIHPRERWWTRPASRRLVLAEAAKWLAYRVLPIKLLVSPRRRTP